MLQTNFGATGDQIAYLRPETAQSIFVQYKNVLDSNRVKLPFGIAQMRQVVPQRDQPAQFHLPLARVRADGDRILLPSGRRPAPDRRVAGGAPEVLRRDRHSRARSCTSSTSRTASAPSIRRRPTTSNTSSPSASRSWKASPTAPTTTSASTRKARASRCCTSTRRRRKNSCRMSWNRPPVATAPCSR